MIPTTPLVAVGWLKGVTGIVAAQVATRLPKDTSTWTANGFVTVPSAIGGGGLVELPVVRPVVEVHTWARNPNGSKPPIHHANQLAELIRADTWDAAARWHRLVVLGGGYDSARVTYAHVVGEPRRVDNDPSSYAHFTLDLELHWVRVPV